MSNGPSAQDWANDFDTMAAADRKHADNPVQAPTPAKRNAFLKSAAGNTKQARDIRSGR